MTQASSLFQKITVVSKVEGMEMYDGNRKKVDPRSICDGTSQMHYFPLSILGEDWASFRSTHQHGDSQVTVIICKDDLKMTCKLPCRSFVKNRVTTLLKVYRRKLNGEHVLLQGSRAFHEEHFRIPAWYREENGITVRDAKKVKQEWSPEEINVVKGTMEFVFNQGKPCPKLRLHLINMLSNLYKVEIRDETRQELEYDLKKAIEDAKPAAQNPPGAVSKAKAKAGGYPKAGPKTSPNPAPNTTSSSGDVKTEDPEAFDIGSEISAMWGFSDVAEDEGVAFPEEELGNAEGNEEKEDDLCDFVPQN